MTAFLTRPNVDVLGTECGTTAHTLIAVHLRRPPARVAHRPAWNTSLSPDPRRYQENDGEHRSRRGRIEPGRVSGGG